MYLEASERALSGIKRSIFHKQKARLFCSTKLTNSLKVESVCLETQITPLVDLHTVSDRNGLILVSSIMAGQNLIPPLSCWWRTRTGGQWWEESSIWPTHLVHQGSMAFISEYHIGEIHFLVLPHLFQPFRLLPLVKRWPCLAWWQQISGDDFGILQALKICLIEASRVFTACR